MVGQITGKMFDHPIEKDCVSDLSDPGSCRTGKCCNLKFSLIARLFSGILKDVPQPLVIVRELRSDLWVPVLVTLNPSESIANYGDLLVPYGDARIDQHAS